MKRLAIPILFLLFILINGCDKSDNSVEPTPPKTSGENTVHTNSKVIGFSFSHGGNIEYPNSNNITPEIVAMTGTNETGTIATVGLASAGWPLKPTFKLIKQFTDTETNSAQAFFDNLAEVPASDYVGYTFPLKVNQIWAIKTIDDKFGKILILHTEAYFDNSNPSSSTQYGEVSFKWKYQPNGSRNF